ncbi:endonuclease yhcR [Marinococcus halotolerans]|uniref:endonuclease yhcR n=1 Tax=Marinococcus halotolerans TaxID=301092 RepID=UPI0003B6087B|nr:endonuclease yhcR [Marinococcus halotolerans]
MNKRLVYSVSLTVVAGGLILGGVTSAEAEVPADPAPELLPDNPNGEKVLFDNSHGQTAGAADWVIDGAFSDFGEALQDEGYEVRELRQEDPISLGDLSAYDVFVMPEANIPLKTSEQQALEQYAEQGGSIFFISDHYNADRNKNRWDSSEIMNGYRRGAFNEPTKGMSEDEAASEAMQGVESSDWLSEEFGVRFRYNSPGTVTADQVVSPEESFGITEGVDEVAMHAGSTMAITDPELAKGIVYLPDGLTEADKWGPSVDEGIYHGGGTEEGPFVAVSKKEQGKAAFIGDSSPVEDATPKYKREETGESKRTYDGFTEADDAVLLVQTVDWLAEQESYTSLNETNVSLDEPSPLLDKEKPQESTQPEPEPWSQPADGYLWYDPDTFAPGSYGSDEAPVEDPSYMFSHMSLLPIGENFTVDVEIDNVEPGETVSGLSLGIYLDGGQQVAQVQREDGSWPSDYGYSEAFSITADENGVAKTTLTIRTAEHTAANANMRIRQNGNNEYTESVNFNSDSSENPEEETASVPISNARQAADGETVTVEGTITTDPGLFGSNGFYLQDESAGIYVYQNSGEWKLGDRVAITAPVTTYNTEKELIDPVSIEKRGTEEVPEAQTVTAVGEENQGQRVKLQNGTISSIEQVGNSFEFTIEHDDTETLIRVDGRTGYGFSDFNEAYATGDTVDVTGISSIYQGTYQLKPTTEADIQQVKGQDTQAPEISGLSENQFSVTEAWTPEAEITDNSGSSISVEYTLEDWKGEELPPLTILPGEHELTVTAIDTAGNKAEKTYPVEALLETEDLDDLMTEANANNWITDKKAFQQLMKRAEKVQQAPNDQAAAGKWQAAVNYASAKEGKTVTDDLLAYMNSYDASHGK